MERRIAETPASEWDDLNINLAPRDGILSFLMHAFPVQLQEPFTDDDGNVMSRPATDADGNPVIFREAEEQRDTLIQKLAAQPPVYGLHRMLTKRAAPRRRFHTAHSSQTHRGARHVEAGGFALVDSWTVLAVPTTFGNLFRNAMMSDSLTSSRRSRPRRSMGISAIRRSCGHMRSHTRRLNPLARGILIPPEARFFLRQRCAPPRSS